MLIVLSSLSPRTRTLLEMSRVLSGVVFSWSTIAVRPSGPMSFVFTLRSERDVLFVTSAPTMTEETKVRLCFERSIERPVFALSPLSTSTGSGPPSSTIICSDGFKRTASASAKTPL